MKKITNFDDYLIYEDGSVFNNKRGYFLKQRNTGFGAYLTVQMFDNSRKRKTKYVHRLVAEAFIDNPDSKPVVNHKDGDKTNNHVSNLEWMTVSENVQHAYDTGLHVKASSTESHNTELTRQDVVTICELLEQGIQVKDIAIKLKISRHIVKNIKNKSCFKDITSEYNFDKFKRAGRLSKETVLWVCEQIKKGLTNRQILNKSTNANLNYQRLRDIRNRKTFTDITNDLDF